MSDNVTINVYDCGELVDVQTGHNVWVDGGREWIADMLGYASLGPDTPEDTRRLRYFGVGIGGFDQSLLGMVNAPPYSTGYPGTNNQTKDFPIGITALERPVMIDATDWLVDDPNIFFTHLTPHELTVHAIVDGTAGDVVFGSYSQMPLSEAGLFLSDSTITSSSNTVVAYYSFATILLNTSTTLEFVWSVRILP